MRTRDAIRIAVLKTNSFAPFSTMNRVPYHLAIEAFIQATKASSEIKSIYLRHGMTENNWIPAISDIDFTLVIRGDMIDNHEFSFLRKFWNRYRILKNVFPMLGEVEIFREDQIESYTAFRIRGYESSTWKLIHGKQTIQNNYLCTSSRIQFDSIHHAVWFYLDFLLQRFFDNSKHPYLTSREMQRLAMKVLRYSDYFSGKENPNFEEIPMEPSEIVCFVLKKLDKDVERFLAEQGSISVPMILSQDPLQCIFLNPYNHSHFLLNVHSDAAALKTYIAFIRQKYAGRQRAPAIVTPTIFEYMMRFFDPYLYTHLMERRKVFRGADILPDIHPPDGPSFARKVLCQIPVLLMFTRSQNMIERSKSFSFSEKELESIVNRCLFIKLYLESGRVFYKYKELLDESRKMYPDLCEQFECLKRLLRSTDQTEAAMRSFQLLRNITSDIHFALANPQIVKNLFSAEPSWQER